MKRIIKITVTCVLAVSLIPLSLLTAYSVESAQFEIDLKEIEKSKGSALPQNKQPAAQHHKKSTSPRQPQEAPAKTAEGKDIYTVRPGDHLFKILMRDYRKSNREAELMIPEIMRINGLASPTRLTVGQKITITGSGRPAASVAIRHKDTPRKKPANPQVASQPEVKEENSPPISPSKDAVSEPEESPELPHPTFNIRTIVASNPFEIIDSLFAAISIDCKRDHVLEGTTGQGGGEPYSIKVARYAEFAGKKFVFATNNQDPFTYTMLRILDTSGYNIMRINGNEDFQSIIISTLSRLGLGYKSGVYSFSTSGKDLSPQVLEGFMVELLAHNATVFITSAPLDPFTIDKLSASTFEKVVPQTAPAADKPYATDSQQTEPPKLPVSQ